VIRDRGALAREAAPGIVENVYRLQIMNTGEQPREFRIAAEGIPGIAVAGVEQPVAIPGASTRLVPLRLQAPADAAKPGANRIEFVVEAVGDARLARREVSTFILPR
jgi:polyferredoxin